MVTHEKDRHFSRAQSIFGSPALKNPTPRPRQKDIKLCNSTLSSFEFILGWTCWQDQKHLKLAMIAELQKKEPQMVTPSPEFLRVVSSWTLSPPPKAAVPKPSRIGIILQGQFYVYKVDRKLVAKTNDVTGSSHQARTVIVFVGKPRKTTLHIPCSNYHYLLGLLSTMAMPSLRLFILSSSSLACNIDFSCR